MTKEDFKKLNSTEIDAELTKKYKELDNSITNLKIENAKEKNAYIKKYNKSLDTLKKNFKAYNDSYSKLVNSSTYTPEVKDKLLLFPKYQMIMNLTYFITELKEGL